MRDEAHEEYTNVQCTELILVYEYSDCSVLYRRVLRARSTRAIERQKVHAERTSGSR